MTSHTANLAKSMGYYAKYENTIKMTNMKDYSWETIITLKLNRLYKYVGKS